MFIEKGVDLSVCVVEKCVEVGMFLISWFPHPKIQMVWSIFVFSNQDLSFSAFSVGSGFDLDLENEMVWLVAMVAISGLIVCSCSGFIWLGLTCS